MQRFETGDGSLEYETLGAGPPLLLVHGSVIADPWQPMLGHGDLMSDYQIITYRRRGYGDSSTATKDRNLGDEAADAVAVLDHLGIDQAHVVGHSLAANIVLQAVIDNPQRFLTMTLLEPGLFSVPSADGFEEAMSPVFEIYRSGDHQKAMLLFLGGVGGAEVMARLERELPEGTTEAALRAVPTLFDSDIPAGLRWQLDEQATRALRQPTLLALGAETGPIFQESNAALRALLPHAEHLAVDEAGHFVHVEQPNLVAEALAAFLTNNRSG